VSELNLHGADQAKGIKLVSDHMGRIAVSLDTMRLMLNTFAEELAGADTTELFKRLDAQMEKVLIPIAQETQAREDADLEMNGHDVLQNGKEPESSKTRDTGRGL